MTELELYTQVVRNQPGKGIGPEDCSCGGCGWILSQLDVFNECPDHFDGQTHPEDPEG